MVAALIVTDEIAANQRYLFHPRARNGRREQQSETELGMRFFGECLSAGLSAERSASLSSFNVHRPGNGGRRTSSSFCSSVLQFESRAEQEDLTEQKARLPLAFRKAVRSKRERKKEKEIGERAGHRLRELASRGQRELGGGIHAT